MTGSAEQLDITQDGEANGALLAISIMVQGVAGSEFNVIDMMKDFRDDLKDDGQWTGKTARTVIADFAYEADSLGRLGSYRSNVASWGLSNTVPAFERYIKDFWGLEYGIGRCTEDRIDEIKKNQNSASEHKDDYFVCESNGWRYIGEFEYNTKNNVCDVAGLVIPGNIDKDKYYICGNGWREATAVEVDKYYTECTMDGKLHKFSDGKYYKCSNDEFVLADPLDTALGQVCVSYLEGKSFDRKNDIHTYTCKNGSWKVGWATGNCTKDGKIAEMFYEASDKKKGYVCDADTFRVATANDSLYNFACVSYADGKSAERQNAIHTYTCEKNVWKISDAWSKTNCAKDGSIQNLIYDEIGSKKNFICDTDTFRVATKTDSSNISLYGKACVSYTDGNVYERKNNVFTYTCKNSVWTKGWSKNNCKKDGLIYAMSYDESDAKKDFICDTDTFRVATYIDSSDVSNYGVACVSYIDGKTDDSKTHSCLNGMWSWNGNYESFKDTRDGKIYKAIQIGSQKWMAENLNFEYKVDGSTYGNLCNTDDCEINGRYYTWAAAMDSAGIYSDNGKGCGLGETCTIKTPARGVCPKGWHLPDTTEWETLYKVAGYKVKGHPYTLQAKGYKDWPNATDAYGFSAIPVGFWSTSEFGSYCADGWVFTAAVYDLYYVNKSRGLSVRCIKD